MLLDKCSDYDFLARAERTTEDDVHEKPAKVLLIGFSVTADSNGYIPVVKKHFASADSNIEIDYCGVGGVTPFPLQSVFAVVNKQRGPYTHVFLEIATSIYGKSIKSVAFDALDVLYDLFYEVQKSGAQLALVSLYRDDFDYQYHYFDMLIEALCARHQLPFLDLAYNLISEKGRKFCQTLLRDAVHTSEVGANFQGQEVSKFIHQVVTSKSRNKVLPRPRHTRSAIAISEALPDKSGGIFKRSGFEAEFVPIAENYSETIGFPKKSKVTGLAFLSGPKSGKISLKFDSDAKEIIVNAYDEHCFYERYNFYRLSEPVECKSITITQLSGRPNVVLRRGEADVGERVGKILAVHIVSKFIG